MQVSAPTSTHDIDLLEEFHEQLESTIKQIPTKDLLNKQIDWSVKIGVMNNGQEQWDTFGREKPMKEEKDFWNS